MIQLFVDRFIANKPQLEALFTKAHPEDYKSLVAAVVTIISSDDYGDLDFERVHQIDDGDYQGTLLFVIAAKGYQPSNYWAVKVSYGSCSGCDTLQDIRDYSDDPPTKEQVDKYMTLALHIVQELKEI